MASAYLPFKDIRKVWKALIASDSLIDFDSGAMKSLHIFVIIQLISSSFASSSSPSAEPCIPQSANSPSIDDVPAINAALEECGNDRPILIPPGKTYNILSALDFSPYNGANFQLEGTLNVSADSTFWKGNKSF